MRQINYLAAELRSIYSFVPSSLERHVRKRPRRFSLAGIKDVLIIQSLFSFNRKGSVLHGKFIFYARARVVVSILEAFYNVRTL